MKDVKTQLEKLQRESAPAKDFKQALKAELDYEFNKLYPSAVPNWRRALAMPVALGIVLVTMGMGTYAYASPEVTEDHALYRVKRGIERIEQEFKRSPEARAKFHARMMERRIAEGEVMLRRNHVSKEQLYRIADELDLSVEQIQAFKDTVEYRRELIQHLETQASRYEYLILSVIEQEMQDSEATVDSLRNKLHEIRVRMDESDLTEEEKRALFLRLEPKILELREQFEQDYLEYRETSETEKFEAEVDSIN
ncbi:hypothetical protein IH979_01930 [Patescibacteria group bacterium]|nr:hypothetical protein [Patescibacteria group bacterium]